MRRVTTIPPGCPGVGARVADKYEVLEFIGAGGMGVVLSARHLTLGHTVAIKLLRPEATENGVALERFLREARATVKMQTEHVARILDVGSLENGAPFIVMEHLIGQNLEDVLGQRGPLPVDEAAQYVMQACEAIAEAHSFGWIHRDLKPSNLFLTFRRDQSPLIKVLDFGISKPLIKSALDPTLTRTGAMMGSPRYMAPEQIRNVKNVDTRVDIWALGVITYELLTKVSPFGADSMVRILARIGSEHPPSPRTLDPRIPEPLARLLMRCLEKEPRARIQTIVEFATGLAPFAGERARVSLDRISAMPHHFVPLVPPARSKRTPAAGAFTPGVMSATWRDHPKPARRGRLAFAGAGAVIVVAGAVAFRAMKTDAVSAAPSAAANVAPPLAGSAPAHVTVAPSALPAPPPAIAIPASAPEVVTDIPVAPTSSIPPAPTKPRPRAKPSPPSASAAPPEPRPLDEIPPGRE